MTQATSNSPEADAHLLPFGRVALIFALAFAALYSAANLTRGSIAVWNGWRPKPEVSELSFLPPDLRRLDRSIARYERIDGWYHLGIGALLAIALVAAWRYRKRIVCEVESAARQRERARRYSLVGIAAICLGAISSPYFHGALPLRAVIMYAILHTLLLIGFGVSVVALAIARDLRLAPAENAATYARALLGVGLSAIVLAWVYVELISRTWWQIR